MSGGNYTVILQATLFFALAWLAERGLKALKVSPLIGPIFVGILLGPQVLNIVPYAESTHHVETDSHGHEHEVTLPGFFTLAGTVGVTLRIVESGFHLDLDTVRAVGGKAFLVAVLGTFLPLLAGIAAGAVMGLGAYPSGFSMGASLAPTSVGIALVMLGDAKQLNSVFGQTIITAAFIDDILSLLLLVVLMNLAGGTVSFLAIGVPLISAVAFVGAGVALAVGPFPKYIPRILKKIEERSHVSLQPRDEAHLGLMLAWLVFCGWVGSVIGSHLLGAFVCGVSFTNVPRSMLVWKRQLKRIANWLVRLFFAASVAFSIPLKVMLSVDALWKGLALGLVGAVGTKVIAGVCTDHNRWVIGWAMVARGEFAYLVSEQAVSTQWAGHGRNMMSPEAYAIVVWALLVSTVVSPFAFKKILTDKLRNTRVQRSRSIGRRTEENLFVIRLEAMHHSSMLHEVTDALHEMRLDVVEANVESDGTIDVDVFTVKPRIFGEEITEDKLREIKHEILEVVDDPEAQVVFMQCEMLKDTVLEIKFMSRHHKDTLHEVCDVLHDLDLDVSRMCVQEHDGTDVDVFYCVDKEKETCSMAPFKRDQTRFLLNDALGHHGCGGDILIKLIPKHDVFAVHSEAPAHKIAMSHTCTLRITAKGDHHEELLHALVDKIHEYDLDIVYADCETIRDPSGAVKDVDVFYAHEPEGAPVTPKARRREIKRALQSLYDSHGWIGVVKVHLHTIDALLDGGLDDENDDLDLVTPVLHPTVPPSPNLIIKKGIEKARQSATTIHEHKESPEGRPSKRVHFVSAAQRRLQRSNSSESLQNGNKSGKARAGKGAGAAFSEHRMRRRSSLEPVKKVDPMVSPLQRAIEAVNRTAFTEPSHMVMATNDVSGAPPPLALGGVALDLGLSALQDDGDDESEDDESYDESGSEGESDESAGGDELGLGMDDLGDLEDPLPTGGPGADDDLGLDMSALGDLDDPESPAAPGIDSVSSRDNLISTHTTHTTHITRTTHFSSGS